MGRFFFLLSARFRGIFCAVSSVCVRRRINCWVFIVKCDGLGEGRQVWILA